MDFGLVMILSLDSLFACMAFGMKKIKIPFLSMLILSTVGTVFFSLSLFFGRFLSNAFAAETIKWIGFFTLLLIGLINTGETLIKRLLQNRPSVEHSLKVNCVRLTWNIYLDKTCADSDCSKTLSCPEALFLAVPLSVDSLFTGLSASPASTGAMLLLIAVSLVCGIICAVTGILIGKYTKSARTDLSWIGGVLLILLAIGKLI